MKEGEAGMNGREKVIKGLKCCFTTANCDGCPYEVARRKISFKTPDNHCPILDDIITLLKEQEAVEPILKRKGKSKAYNDYACPVCDQEIVYEQNYCSECGKLILWKGSEQE